MLVRMNISIYGAFLVSSCVLIPCAGAQSSGAFDFLTYNVAGLPAFINDNGVPGDKATNARLIGSKLAQGAYDIAHLQEDFNYHKYIYETDDHPHRTSTSGGVPFGSGLNTVANYGWSSFNRVTWKKCFINEGDCLTPKGFSMMRLTPSSGVEIDFYNLHADAGSDQKDFDARRSSVEQLLAYIDTNSVGRAVVIGGDTNDRYTNEQLSINLLTDAGFSDSWIELIKGGQFPTPGSASLDCGVPASRNDCEVVDKVLYRSGDSVKLVATSWSYASSFFVQPDGNVLSDHNPIHVNFTWSA